MAVLDAGELFSPRFMKTRPDGPGGSLSSPFSHPRFLPSRDRRYYGRRRKLFRQARPDFCDIGPKRRVSACSLSPRGAARDSASTSESHPRKMHDRPSQDTLGRTRNFAGRRHGGDSPAIFPEREIGIPRSSLNPEVSANNGRENFTFN